MLLSKKSFPINSQCVIFSPKTVMIMKNVRKQDGTKRLIPSTWRLLFSLDLALASAVTKTTGSRRHADIIGELGVQNARVRFCEYLK